MDCLFISPDSSRESYQGLAQDYSAIELPTWAVLLAGALRSRFEVAILDPLAEGLTDEQAVARVLDAKPHYVCFVVYGQNPNSGTTNMAGAERLARLLKAACGIPLVFIGSHVSALPEQSLELPYVDYVLPGDGLQALEFLLEYGAQPQVMWSQPAQSFKGVYAWDLLPGFQHYRAHDWHANYGARSPAAAIYTSLGCPFKCDFCMINLVNRSHPGQRDASESTGIRKFETGHVLADFEYLRDRGVRNVRISDEMFFLDRRHYAPIVQGLIERDLGLNLWAYARVDTVRAEYLSDFKRAGINWLALGIEAGNQSIRREASKGSFEDTDVRQVVREIQAHGINVVGNYIFGLPDDTLDTMMQTLDLALELRTEHANFYPCMALPGSPLARRALADGALEGPRTWSSYGFLAYDCMPLPTKMLSAAEVLRFRDEAWHTYFTDRGYLEFVERKFGTSEHLRKQAAVPLKRKLLE